MHSTKPRAVVAGKGDNGQLLSSSDFTIPPDEAIAERLRQLHADKSTEQVELIVYEALHAPRLRQARLGLLPGKRRHRLLECNCIPCRIWRGEPLPPYWQKRAKIHAIRLPDALWLRVHRVAIETDISCAAIIRRALRELLAREERILGIYDKLHEEDPS